jgi:hypothetical protein
MEAIKANSGTIDYNYLVDRYSQSLTKYDIKALFEKLKERTGSVTAATKEIEITRKTVYDWEKTTDEIKASTKRKILQTSLEADYYWTLGFLARKTNNEYQEILRRYIDSKVERIKVAQDIEDFESQKQDFVKFLKVNTGAILDLRNTRIEKILFCINEKAASIGAEGIPDSVEYMNPRELSTKFLHLLQAITLKSMPKKEMAHSVRLPPDFINQACTLARYIDPTCVEVTDSILAEDSHSIALNIKNTHGTFPYLGFDSHSMPYDYSLRAGKRKW